MKEQEKYEEVIRKLEEQEAWLNRLGDSPAIHSAASMAERYVALEKAIEPISAALEPYHDFWNANTGVITAVNSIAAAMEPYQEMDILNSRFLTMLESAVKTPELLSFQTQLENSLATMGSGLSVISDYVSDLSSQWENALSMTNIMERSIAAQNFALVRVLPDYGKLDLPRGSKRVLKSLTKTTAEKLIQTEDILFDPKERNFYHKDSPEQRLTADQVTVVESSQDLFADISLDELISFESQLYEDVTFALDHPVGKKIFEIIKGWNTFINFDSDIYYHARQKEEGQEPFLDQEMLKAPTNVSSHGRYNAIGKSCYYIAETKEGAVSEISKHSGGKKIEIQVVGLRPVKTAKIIDLSGEIQGTNRFMEHLRFTVENEEGKLVKKYLLPNFVASCCKKIKIDGIKYKSTGYNCCVLWKDDYFEFVEGSRDIV